MNVDFTCPGCETRNSADLTAGSELACDRCDWSRRVPDTLTEAGAVDACPVCRCPHLYWRKDFPAKLGLSIVVVGLAVSCITWNLYMPVATFVVLFATGLLDLLVYLLVGEVLVCYRCRAHVRGAGREGQAAFDLSVAERYRQEQQRMRSEKERTS